MEALSRAELFAMLDRRIDDPSLAAAQDAEIWSRCGVERTILVVDLSGFTRLTRTRGILHFLSVYRRATRIAEPLFTRHRGRCVKREADNLIYTFVETGDALAAARALCDASAALDASVHVDERVLPCIGIGHGRILELTDDVFGDEVNLAFKLGEDLARPREILLSEAALAQLGREGIDVRPEPCDVELAGLSVRYHALRADAR